MAALSLLDIWYLSFALDINFVTLACKFSYFLYPHLVNALCLAFINALILGVIHSLSVLCTRIDLSDKYGFVKHSEDNRVERLSHPHPI